MKKTWRTENPKREGDFICRMMNAYIKMCHWTGTEWLDMWKTTLDGVVIEWMVIPYEETYRTINDDYMHFDVPGAGKIELGDNCHSCTGRVVGFNFGVEWGRYGYAGGVLGRDEAKRMAEYILNKCNEVDESMTDEYNRLISNMNASV